MDFIEWINAQETNDEREATDKMNMLRSAYRQAVIVPTAGVVAFWKDYQTLENDAADPNDRTMAQDYIQSLLPKYNGARLLYRDRAAVMEGIDLNAVAKPIGVSAKFDGQVHLWKRILEYELTNPEQLGEADKFLERISFTYEQALLTLYRCADIWAEYAEYMVEHKEEDAEAAAEAIYQRGLDACPTSLLLHFSYCDFLEDRKRAGDARKHYQKVVDTQPGPLVAVQFLKFLQRTEGKKASRAFLPKVITKDFCTYHVLVAAARMEHHLNGDSKVARNIYEHGMSTKFAQEPDFVNAYLDFLMELNDLNNTRVVFERALNALEPERSLDIWNRFVNFELEYGERDAVGKLEKRRADVFPDKFDVVGLGARVHRYGFMDLFPCGAQERSLLGRAKLPAKELPSVQMRNQRGANRDAGERAIVRAQYTGCRPDVNKLSAFDPVAAGVAAGTVTGFGGIELPPATTALLTKLPPPHAFPKTDELQVEEILKILRGTDIPDAIVAAVKPTVIRSVTSNSGGTKRKLDGDEVAEAAPVNDLYRQRQRKKLSKFG